MISLPTDTVFRCIATRGWVLSRMKAHLCSINPRKHVDRPRVLNHLEVDDKLYIDGL